MELILKSNQEKKERVCILTGKIFTNDNGFLVVNEYNQAVDFQVALKNNFRLDKDFRIPDNITSCEKLGKWLDSINVKHASPEFRQLYKRFSENLPLFEPKKQT